MGERVVERILSVGLAMINLQTEPNVPIQMNALVVASQPLDQNLWDSIGMANSDLDWLVHSSVP